MVLVCPLPDGNHGEYGLKWCENSTMPAANIRIPEGLHESAKLEANRLGISLNALLCVALDAYLSRNKPQEAPEAAAIPKPAPPPPAPPNASPEPVLAALAGLSRQQRRALERKNRK